MVQETLVNETTRWACQCCGNCCYKLEDEIHLKLFNKQKENSKCTHLNHENKCNIYNNRPLGCKMYPFYPDWKKLKKIAIEIKTNIIILKKGQIKDIFSIR